MDNAFGCRDTDGARWIRREKLYGAQRQGVNHGAIASKTHPRRASGHRVARLETLVASRWARMGTTRRDFGAAMCASVPVRTGWRPTPNPSSNRTLVWRRVMAREGPAGGRAARPVRASVATRCNVCRSISLPGPPRILPALGLLSERSGPLRVAWRAAPTPTSTVPGCRVYGPPPPMGKSCLRRGRAQAGSQAPACGCGQAQTTLVGDRAVR